MTDKVICPDKNTAKQCENCGHAKPHSEFEACTIDCLISKASCKFCTDKLAYEKGVFNLPRCMEIDGGKCINSSGELVTLTQIRLEQNEMPIVGIVKQTSGREYSENYKASGEHFGGKLFNLPPEKLTRTVTMWFDVFPIDDGGYPDVLAYNVMTSEIEKHSDDIIARVYKTIEIEYEDGQFDESGGE